VCDYTLVPGMLVLDLRTTPQRLDMAQICGWHERSGGDEIGAG